MIKANPSKPHRLLFNFYIDNQLKKHFSRFIMVNDPPETLGCPMIVTPNHFSWWDGFFIDFTIRKLLRRNLYILMLEEQLKRYWYFKYLGAFSINRDNPKEIVKANNYISTILPNKDNYLVIYPQGDIYPFNHRPIELKRGLQYFVKGAPGNLIVLPVAFKIEYSSDKTPNVLVRFGTAVDKHVIQNNFEEYNKLFVKNIDLLNSASPLSGKDLFKC